MITYYILQLLVIMTLATPIVVVTRVVYFKKTKKQVNKWHELLLLLFITFCAGLTTQTILPHNFNLEFLEFSLDNFNITPFSTIIEMFTKSPQVAAVNIIGNIVMFAPFGFFPSLLWRKFHLGKAAWLTFNISFCIEIVQLFIKGRATDIDDLILNTLGGIVGWCVYWLFIKIFPKFSEKFLS
jgi:Glycopeptide antibiotics resistance protein